MGTPTNKKTYDADLKYVFQVVKDIKKNLNKYKIIILKVFEQDADLKTKTEIFFGSSQ